MTNEQIPSYTNDYKTIQQIIQDYFDGLYEGDVAKLRRVFHHDAWLKAPNYRKSRDEWLDAVASRSIPKIEGMMYQFNILSIEVVKDQAMVKVNAPLLAGHYIDFLGLLKEDGQWKIVNKMFTMI